MLFRSSSSINVYQIQDTTAELSDFEENTIYFWRVAANSSVSEKRWSKVRVFRTTNNLFAFDLIYPANQQTNVEYNTRLRWHNSFRSQEYYVQVAKDPDFNLLVNEMYVMTDTAYKTVNLQPYTEYFWRVVALRDFDFYVSDIWSFITGDYVSVSEEFQSLSHLINVFPNPFDDRINIKTSNVKIEEFSIRMFNSIGMELTLDSSTSEDCKIINTQNLPSGFYIVEIKSGGQSICFVLMKIAI